MYTYIFDNGLEESGLPYHPPTTKAFTAFTHHLVEEAGLAAPTALRPRAIHAETGHLRIDAEPTSITTNWVVIATNPHRLPAAQRKMVEIVDASLGNATTVHEMGTGHSPMAADPVGLADILVSMANN